VQEKNREAKRSRGRRKINRIKRRIERRGEVLEVERLNRSRRRIGKQIEVEEGER
jgi:hypothetical protein